MTSQNNKVDTDSAEAPVKGVGCGALVRAVLRLRIVAAFLSEYRWYRRAHGGKWMQSHVDHPVCSCCWMNVPDHATLEYREPLWRGTPRMEVWP